MMKPCCVLNSAQERAVQLGCPPKAARLGSCPCVGQQGCLAGDKGSASLAGGVSWPGRALLPGNMPSLGLGGAQQVEARGGGP